MGWFDLKKLKSIWDKWLHFGRLVGDYIGKVILSVFYFTIALPFGLFARFGSNALDISGQERWLPKKSIEVTIERARRLF